MEKMNTWNIEKLQKKIIDLEKEIRFAKSVDARHRWPEKIRKIKKKKIDLEMRKLLMPYLLTAGLVVGGLKLTGEGFPFYKEDVKKYLVTEETSERMRGAYTLRKTYLEEKPINSILYYSAWQRDENGVYFRDYTYCETNAVDVMEIFDVNKTLFFGWKSEWANFKIETLYGGFQSVEEYFKYKAEERKNTSDSLEEPLEFGNIETYREILQEPMGWVNNEPGFIAHLYEIDKEKFIYDKESDEQNRRATILFIALTSGGFMLIGNRKEILRKMNEMQHYPYKSRKQLELKLKKTRKQINKYTDKHTDKHTDKQY